MFARQVWLWRLLAWTAVVLVTGASAHPLWAQLAGGATLALAALALQWTGDERSVRTCTAAVVAATVLGLASVLIAPSGLGEVAAFWAASRIPFPISQGAGRAFVIADTLAVGAVVGFVSQSLVGVLAGLGVPLLAQRAVERRALIASRDEARALLTEVQAGREAEQQAAALQERGRIARELHDVLAHTLAGLSVQLQATRAIAARDGVGPAVLDPLDRAAALARDGVQEARTAVGALRDPVGLGLDELPALIARQPGEVTLDVRGQARPVDPQVGHTAYRAVQEALTNAARYAPGAPVTVTVTYADGVRICVEDSGLPQGRAPVTTASTGLGLAGMSERAAAAGGTVTAGPRPDGGWRVEVCLP
jgi:signal transduction histidine kinase